MGKYSINAYKLDEVCDLLDEYDIPGNVLGETLAGEPFVKIWKGTYERLQERDFCESDILFKIYWWPSAEKYALHVLDKECAEQIKSLWQSECGMPNIYLFKTPRAMIDTIKMLFSHKEKTDMTICTKNKISALFDELNKRHIPWKSLGIIGSYPTIEIYSDSNARNNALARIRVRNNGSYGIKGLLPYRCDKDNWYPWGLVESIGNICSEIYNRYTICEDDWRKVDITMKNYDNRNRNRIKDVIFNDPATIVFWNDGTKTVVQAVNEPFDPEKGLAMAICRKAFGNKYDYYDIFKKYVGRYEKKQKKG